MCVEVCCFLGIWLFGYLVEHIELLPAGRQVLNLLNEIFENATSLSGDIAEKGNFIYDFVARNRYKWFGRSDVC